MNRESIKRDIAVIGISCRFSKSADTKEFWETLKAGDEMIQFYTDHELEAMGVDSDTISNPAYVKIKTFVEGTDSFDYPFFDYVRDEANMMDPQIRVLHEQVWLALEDAGCNPKDYQEKIGIYMTASDNFNWIAHTMMCENKNIDPFYLSQISNKNFASTLISYNLNLKGPSVVLDTACSSSLTTVHLASRALLLRECTLAIAGGINLNTTTTKGYFHQEGMIPSKDGHCKTFDADSTGTSGSEGSGIIILKRLEEAIVDKDHIYAVIRSTAVNNDGRRKVGFTAPSVSGQAECIKAAHSSAKVPYQTITYVEAHGTGTKLGDPIEIEALNKAFNYDKSHSCAIGSLKSNAGHLGNAAGIAGLIKTTLALKNKLIPPSLHFTNPNPDIDFAGGPFHVNTMLKKWERIQDVPLRAGVSSFGIGGTNVHAILESYVENESQGKSARPYQIITYSAKTLSSLDLYSAKLSKFITSEIFALADLAYTLQTGRAKMLHFNTFVCKDQYELLEHAANTAPHTYQVQKSTQDIVFTFPGQGSQYFQMGKDLYDHEPEFKVIMDHGLTLLSRITSVNYQEILGYHPAGSIDLNRLNETQYTQPLLFLIEYALATVLINWGIKPRYLIGHSLGEYTAACVAEVFSLEDGLSLIVKRAMLMASLETGCMVAVAAPLAALTELINDQLSVAAINTDDTCVLSGSNGAIKELTEKLLVDEISFSELKTSHAFHSAMMDPILKSFETAINSITLNRPKLAYISNLTGKPILPEEAISSAYWLNHLRNTVQFKSGLDFLFTHINPLFIEVGPGKTIATFIRQHNRYSSQTSVIPLLRSHREIVNDNKKFTQAIAELSKAGISIDWKAYYIREKTKKIPAPTYCFDTYKLDYEVDPQSMLSREKRPFENRPISSWFYQINWKKSVYKTKKADKSKSQRFLIFSSENVFITTIIKKLEESGDVVIRVKDASAFSASDPNCYHVDRKEAGDFLKLFKALELQSGPIDQVIFNFDFKNEDQETLLKVFEIFNIICKALQEMSPGHKKKMTVLSYLGNEILGIEESNPVMIASILQLSVFSQETPEVFSCYVDVAQDVQETITIKNIVLDIKENFSEKAVAFRNSNRWIEFFESMTIDTNEIETGFKSGVYLITGGLGKIGRLLAKYLGNNAESKIILVGRTELPNWSSREGNQAGKLLQPELTAVEKEIQTLMSAYHNVFYYQGDAADLNSLAQVVNIVEETHGMITGIIHAAGNLRSPTFQSIENLTVKLASEQFAPKVQGLLNLVSIFEDRRLDFVWITSSLSSILGGLTFGAYAVANAFMDAFIKSKKARLPNWTTINLDGIGDQPNKHHQLIEVFKLSMANKITDQTIISLKDLNRISLQSEATGDQAQPYSRVVDRVQLGIDYVPPETTTEESICEMMQSFFGYQHIGVTDNFFEIGGDSLKAMTLINRMNKLYQVNIDIRDFYANPTIKELAREVETGLKIKALQSEDPKESTMII